MKNLDKLKKYYNKTIITDLSGNSYVTQGSIASILKVNNAGVQVWYNANPSGGVEFLEFKLDNDLNIIVYYTNKSYSFAEEHDFKLPKFILKLLLNNNKIEIQLALNLIK